MNAISPRPRPIHDRRTASRLHTMLFADLSGHLSIAWDPENDSDVLPFIAKKMQEGYEFWVIERGWFADKPVRLTHVSRIGSRREVRIQDSDLRKLFADGSVGILKAEQEGDIVRLRKTTDPAEVAANDTMVGRQMIGG